jgi:hypothetical protein
MKLFKKNILNMKEPNTITEITSKMEYMNKILESNLFNNPIKEINEDIRMELLQFREIFMKNLNTLEQAFVTNYNF